MEVGEVIKVQRGGKRKAREETDEEEDEEEEEKEKENVRKKRKKTEEAEREEREWRVQMEQVLTRIDEREQQREVREGQREIREGQREIREGQREIRERHLVKVADWVAAMICDATKRVRGWDMERKKAETGSSGSEETDKETENREKVEVGGGEDGTEENTGDGGQMEVEDRWRWTRTERRMKGTRRQVRRRRRL